MIVSGDLGANGPHVRRPVEMEFKKEIEKEPQRPKMEERNALVVIQKEDLVLKENVLKVCIKNAVRGLTVQFL